MNVSEIITAFGAYYLNSGQNMNNILRMLTQGAVTPSFMTPIKTEETIYRMSSVTVGSLVQSFQKDWTPSDPGIFVPNEIRKRHMKIDIDIFPDDIEDTWLGFLASNNLSKKDWPLIRYMIEKVYIPKIHESLLHRQVQSSYCQNSQQTGRCYGRSEKLYTERSRCR